MDPSPARIVIDTNVALDLVVFRDRRVAALAAAIAAGDVAAHTDAAGVAELERVLGYPELRLDATAAERALAEYLALVVVAAPESVPAGLPRCKDPDDQHFLELAVGLAADALLTRDRELLALAGRVRRFAPGLRIVVPERFADPGRS